MKTKNGDKIIKDGLHQTACGRMYYKKFVNENAKNLLLISGLTRDHNIWRYVTPMLKEDFNIIVFDNRDSGQSFRPEAEYTIEDMADDTISLLGQLQVSAAHIVGHSMGGFIALYISLKKPELVQSLSLCSTASSQVPAAKDYLTKRIAFMQQQQNKSKNATTATKEDIENAMQFLYGPEFLNNEEKKQEVLQFELSNQHPQSADAFKRQAIACREHQISEDDLNRINKNLKENNASVNIITGKHDQFYTPNYCERMSVALHGTLTVLGNSAHMVQIEAPEELADIIKTCATGQGDDQNRFKIK